MDATLPLTKDPKNYIDGPDTPAPLQLIKWIRSPLKFIRSQRQRYGDIFSAKLGYGTFGNSVLVCHPQGIKDIFTANSRNFDSGRINQILRPLVGPSSLLLLDGQPHLRQRKLMMPAFHGRSLPVWGADICQIAEEEARSWPSERPFSARAASERLTLKVIFKVVFGSCDRPRDRALQGCLEEYLGMLGSPLKSSVLFIKWLQINAGAWSPWGKFLRCRQQIDDLIYAEIGDRRREPPEAREKRNDLLALLMAAEYEDGTGQSDRELRDQLLTVLLAGYETTATALAWALYWVHRHPAVRQRLLDELDSLGGDRDPMALYQLPYLDAVCNETLRLYPVAFITFPRLVNAPMDVMGRRCEPGTVLLPCIYGVHHRPDLYPEPHRFLPERFLARDYSPYEFFPFGGGNRRCMGKALATYEIKLALASILSCRELGLANTGPVKPVRRGPTLAPNEHLRLRATERPASVPAATPAYATAGG